MATSSDIRRLVTLYEGIERTRYLSIASVCCLVYDLLLTYDDEVRFFWGGHWTLSRVLFFVNRYFPIIPLTFLLIALLAPNVSVTMCSLLIHVSVLLTIIGVAIIQSVIVLRICYVYSRSFWMRAFVIGCFISCTLVTISFLGTLWPDLNPKAFPNMATRSCNAPSVEKMWKLFAPNLVLHTVLFLVTTIPALRRRRMGKQSRLMDRLARDGGVFYFVVFCTVIFSTTGSLSKSPLVEIPASDSGIILALCSVAVSRLMLSIHSLAAHLSLTPEFLLNHTELSRVNWKRGRQGELIVEIDSTIEDDLELEGVEDSTRGLIVASTPAVYTSRVGVLEDSVYPGTRDYKAPPPVRKKLRTDFNECTSFPQV